MVFLLVNLLNNFLFCCGDSCGDGNDGDGGLPLCHLGPFLQDQHWVLEKKIKFLDLHLELLRFLEFEIWG